MLEIKKILGEDIARINEERLNRLKKRVEENRVTWILGAGISKSVGVPLWKECLLRMWGQILLLEVVEKKKQEESEEQKGKKRVKSAFQKTRDELKKKIEEPEKFLGKVNNLVQGKGSADTLISGNMYEAAEYIQNFLEEMLKDNAKENLSYSDELRDMEYTSLVRDALKPKEELDKIAEKLKKEVLGLLAEYFVKKADEKVEVISYNFDNLLEFALEENKLDKAGCHIKNPDTKNVLESKDGVHIYHPHGMVSVMPTEYSTESNRLVLAEEGYERLERKAYLWENAVQAKALQSTSCIFLGFSGDDYNFRRIIKDMERGKECQQIKHYLFMSIESLMNNIFEKEINKKILGDERRTEEERTEYLDSIDKKERNRILEELLDEPDMVYERMLLLKKLEAQDMYWNSYNIVPIWTTRGELPKMVKEIIK